MSSPDREALIRQLSEGSAAPRDPHHLLVLLTPEQARQTLPPLDAMFVAIRRAELYKQHLILRDHVIGPRSRGTAPLTDEEFCRYHLLTLLFTYGTQVVVECWQGILVSRGSKALQAYEITIDQLLLTGCVILQAPAKESPE